MNKKFDFDAFDAKCASILDGLFGNDDNTAVPTAMDMRNSGFGDEHQVSQPLYTCELAVVPERLHPDREINTLLEHDGAMFESGIELYHEREAYSDSAESLAEWQEELDIISQERAQLGSRICRLIAEYDARN